MILTKKPPQIQAIQFQGGLENAIEVITWLYRQDTRLVATYMPPISGVSLGEEYVDVRLDGIATQRSRWMIHKSRWIVLDPESGIYLSLTANLMAGYDPVPES